MTDFEVKSLVKKLETMDQKSEAFHAIFTAANERYFTFENPDKYQQSAVLINMILHRGDEWMVEMLSNLGEHLFQMVEKNQPASHGTFRVNDREIFFDFYTDKDALASLHKMFRNTVTVKAQDNGVEL